MFNSQFADQIRSYLELRKAIVVEKVYSQDRRVLVSLDKFIFDGGFTENILTEVVLSQWMNTLTGKSKTVREKVSVARNFAKYLNSIGNPSFVLPSPRVKSDYIPYIFSNEEIERIFYYADNLPIGSKSHCMPFIKLKIPMILRILYGCGTRLGETVSIRRNDIDFSNGTILLRHTKFEKERLIPIHNSLLDILKDYCSALKIPDVSDVLLFEGAKEDKPITTRQVDAWFSVILKRADIDQLNKERYERGACIHCLRHLFVLKSVRQLEENSYSVNMNDLLLPTYLGHKCLIDSDKYMRYTGAQSQSDLYAFESFSQGLLPKVEVPYDEE